MERVEGESIWLICPCLADRFIGGEAREGLEASAEIVGVDEVGQVGAKVIVRVIMEAFGLASEKWRAPDALKGVPWA